MRITGPIPNHILEKMHPKDRPKGKAGMTMAEVYARASKRSERETQNQIANYLRQRNIPFNHSRMDKKTTSTIGWPDFTFPYRGRFYGIEVKAPDRGDVSPEQAQCLGMIQDSGGIGEVIRSLPELINILNRTAQ